MILDFENFLYIWMHIFFFMNNKSGSDIIHQFNRGSGVFNPKSVSSQSSFINFSMKICKPFAKLNFFPINRNRTEGQLFILNSFFRKIILVKRQKPFNVCFFEFQKSPDLV